MNQEQMDIKTPEYVSLQFQTAGLGSRAAAFMIDRILLTVTSILIFIVLLFVMKGMEDINLFIAMNTVPVAITIIVLFLLNWGYFFACEFFAGGRTLGKKLIGIRVIQDNGHSITLLSSFIRNFMRIIDSLPSGYLVGIIMVFFHPKHKRLGDVVGGTIVVHERKAKGKKKKLTGIDKELAVRGLTKDDLVLDDWTLKTFSAKDWRLLNTYAARFTQMPVMERNEMTWKMAGIFLPKIGYDVAGKSVENLEDLLLVLYLKLRDEWEFEL